jgi:Na+/serine symporter
VGLTASCFGLGATLSNFGGQLLVEHFDHVTSLMASLVLSIAPICLFTFMPETLGQRGHHFHSVTDKTKDHTEMEAASYRPIS